MQMQAARKEIDALWKNIGKRYRTSMWNRIENAQVEKKREKSAVVAANQSMVEWVTQIPA
jgi:hypothetical protein